MEKKRGSEELFGASHVIDEHVLKEVHALVTKHGELLDWCQYGQPGIDGFCGTAFVNPRSLGALIEKVIQIDHPRIRCDCFPYGIPAIDRIRVDIGTHVGSRGQR